MAKRITRGEYSAFIPTYSRGLDAGFGLGVAGIVAPRVETEVCKDRTCFLHDIKQEVRSLSLRYSGKFGHLATLEACHTSRRYGSNASFEDRIYLQGYGRPTL